ncbi:sigma-E processing peptidase SpoIIGA [Paenibacillus sp. D2_2]|uniref:sigma-E processing peptidase SpoIIGA n=1 Tax=Paenibacillus sp. D2_2 TaxID=3073092 RepID=UPI0028154BB0|nr:sigma-E processing peptidase SpoIIGA [Paenibacillus sp. D2_2]WMT42444.1 sigma-E processing peptidase SpoIIGA [Paenibacillus sp. D2_2]
MGLVVYIDLIFLLNLLIDASLLLVTAWMRKQKFVFWRLLASAAFGAAYVVMMFLPELSFLYTFLVKFLFSVVMLWIAFGFKSLQSYLRNLGAFYVINFVAAGEYWEFTIYCKATARCLMGSGIPPQGA